LDAKVIDLFNKKITSLTAASGNQGAHPGEPSTVAAITNQLAIAAATPLSVSAVEDLHRQIQQLNAQLAQFTGNVQHHYDKTFEDIAIEQLPAVEIPVGAKMVGYGTLYTTLQEWQAAGEQPFDWTVLTPVLGKEAEPIPTAKVLLGDLWKKWYPDSDPTAQSVIPKQVLKLMYFGLLKIKMEFDEETTKNQRKLALEGMEAVRESAKRLRAA